MSNTILYIVQIVVAVIIVISVLLQGGGTGFSGMLSGGESFRTKRGVEKVLFFTTIVAAVTFVLVILVGLLI